MNKLCRILVLVLLAGVFTVLLPRSPIANDDSTDSTVAGAGHRSESVLLKIRHRVHHAFRERMTAKMNERYQIGDTDYFFEIVEFYPHFAIVDSTREVVSLTAEPKNPAFKINVYEDGELVDETWAFYSIKIPHFARTSMIAFEVLSFEYRGVVHGEEEGQENEKDGKNFDRSKWREGRESG